MPIDDKTMDLWFTYHPPTDETRPKHRAVHDIIESCWSVFETAIRMEGELRGRFDVVAKATRSAAEVLNDVVPDSADKMSAMRCLCLARMAANEAILAMDNDEQGRRMLYERMAEQEIIKARWQASAAIALGHPEAS